MPKTEKKETKTDKIRNWLGDNPDGTYKLFAESYDGDDITSSYFSLIKGKVNKAKGTKKTAKKAAKKAKSTNGRRETSIKADDAKAAKPNGRKKKTMTALERRLDTFLSGEQEFLQWVQVGRKNGYVKRLQGRLNS